MSAARTNSPLLIEPRDSLQLWSGRRNKQKINRVENTNCILKSYRRKTRVEDFQTKLDKTR